VFPSLSFEFDLDSEDEVKIALVLMMEFPAMESVALLILKILKRQKRIIFLVMNLVYW
jgi:hypothetical protein